MQCVGRVQTCWFASLQVAVVKVFDEAVAVGF